MYNQIEKDSQSFEKGNMQLFYDFLQNQEFSGNNNVSFVYSLSHPFHLDLWNNLSNQRIDTSQAQLHAHPFFRQSPEQKQREQERREIEALNGDLDDIQPKSTSELRPPKTLSEFQTENFDRMFQKVKEFKAQLRADQERVRQKTRELLGARPIKLTQTGGSLGSSFKFQFRPHPDSLRNFLNLNFSNKYALQITLNSVMEISEFFLHDQQTVQFQKDMELILVDGLGLIPNRSFFQQFESSFCEQQFMKLNNFCKKLHSLEGTFARLDTQRLVCNLSEKEYQFEKLFGDVIHKHRRSREEELEFNKQERPARFRKFLMNDLMVDAGASRRLFDYRKALGADRCLVSNQILDFFILLLNQIYQRVEICWGKVLEVFKHPQTPKEVLQGETVFTFTNQLLHSSILSFLYPAFENNRNILKDCLPRNYHIIHNIDMLLESFMDYYTYGIQYNTEMRSFLTDQEAYFRRFIPGELGETPESKSLRDLNDLDPTHPSYYPPFKFTLLSQRDNVVGCFSFVSLAN